MKMTMARAARLILLVVLTTAAGAAHAGDFTAGPLTVHEPWSRATTPAQQSGGVFMRIANAGDEADRLIAVETGSAATASLHTVLRDGDIMRMRPVEGGIELPAEGEVALAPGGFHVMLVGLERPLVEGERVPLTLVFEHAGRLDIEASIEAAGARGPAARDGTGHGSHSAPISPMNR